MLVRTLRVVHVDHVAVEHSDLPALALIAFQGMFGIVWYWCHGWAMASLFVIGM